MPLPSNVEFLVMVNMSSTTTILFSTFGGATRANSDFNLYTSRSMSWFLDFYFIR
jgi:hypothetical protein